MNNANNKAQEKRTLAPEPPRVGRPPNPINQMLIREGKVSPGHAFRYLRGERKSYPLDKLMVAHGYELPIYRGESK